MNVPNLRCLQTMAWTEPQFSRAEVNAAGRALIGFDWLSDTPDWSAYEAHKVAIPIINNWRSSHDYPLNTFQITLRKYAQKIGSHVIVAQRKKRLSSIELKLSRHRETMKLSQMQDLGGCRAVLRTVREVRLLHSFYKQSNIKHSLASLDDYIDSPKKSGYRGIHLVYKYFSDKQKTAYNGLKIEIQLRSQPQHAWATAVETVGTFLKQALKSNLGEPDWLRFFALMGTGLAKREGTTIVPGTTMSTTELVSELRQLANKLNVRSRLQGYGNALKRIGGQAGPQQHAHFYLLELDASTSELKVTGFAAAQYRLAFESHAEAEKAVASNPHKDVVLVSVDSISALERAYPNYFADTGMFLRLLDEILTLKRKTTSTRIG